MSQTEVQLIKDAVIVNADISNSAAIDVSKISGALPAAGGTITGDVTFDGETAGRDIVFDRSDNALEFLDDAKATFGTGADCSLVHSGADFAITNSTGNLNILCNSSQAINLRHGSENMIRAITDGAVELYHDDSKKFETESSGCKITGSLELTANLVMSDDDKIRLGNSQDLEIFHDGNDSRIQDAGTGDLILTTSRLQVNNAADTEAMINAIQDGPVELYHNNVKKFETTSTGAQLTGEFSHLAGTYTNASGGFVKVQHDSGKFTAGASDDLEIFHDGTASRIHSASHPFYIRSGGQFGVFKGNGTESIITGTPDGAVDLYYDNSKKFETTSDGTKTSGQLKQFAADGNSSFRRDVYYLAIPTNTTKTITLTSLNGTGVFRAGGYTNAGQGALALHVLFGGAMFATQHYQVNELINSGMQNTSISTSKLSTSYTMAITNSSNTFSLILQIYLESTGSAMGYAVS